MLIRLILLTAAAAVTVVAQDCYYPEGNKATDYDFEPCGGENTTFASCCYFGEGDICLGNGLCSYVGHYDYRAACQDKSWEKCQNPCPSGEFSLDTRMPCFLSMFEGLAEVLTEMGGSHYGFLGAGEAMCPGRVLL